MGICGSSLPTDDIEETAEPGGAFRGASASKRRKIARKESARFTSDLSPDKVLSCDEFILWFKGSTEHLAKLKNLADLEGKAEEHLNNVAQRLMFGLYFLRQDKSEGHKKMGMADFTKHLQSLGFKGTQLRELEDAFNRDDDGVVDMREYLSTCHILGSKAHPRDKLRLKMEVWDTDNDDRLSKDEIQRQVAEGLRVNSMLPFLDELEHAIEVDLEADEPGLTAADFKQMSDDEKTERLTAHLMQRLDPDKSGFITRAEFEKAILGDAALRKIFLHEAQRMHDAADLLMRAGEQFMFKFICREFQGPIKVADFAKTLCKKLGYANDDMPIVAELIRNCDQDEDATLTVPEFLNCLHVLKPGVPLDHKLRMHYHAWDLDNDNALTVGELREGTTRMFVMIDAFQKHFQSKHGSGDDEGKENNKEGSSSNSSGGDGSRRGGARRSDFAQGAICLPSHVRVEME